MKCARGCLAGVFLFSLALTKLATAQAAPDPKQFMSAADIDALIVKAKGMAKPGQATVNQPLVQLAPYTASVEYHTEVGLASVHEQEAELVYVLSGSGTYITGGTLAGQKRVNAANLTGTSIDGGTVRNFDKGAIFFVAQGEPHFLSKLQGPVILLSMHVPRTAP